jgi:hypothetical protein
VSKSPQPNESDRPTGSTTGSADDRREYLIGQDDLAEIELLQQAIESRSRQAQDHITNHYAQRLKHVTVRVREYFPEE